MSKLITFITPSRRLDNIKGLIDNLAETTAEPSRIELLIKFDDDQEGVVEFIENEIKTAPFSIRYIRTPRLEGIYSVWVAMEHLFFVSDPDSYFYQIISDEPRFLTKHWDVLLEKYKGFFEDDLFRLRLSDVKLCNYSSHYECTFRPDSFPIYTRRWLELTEGTGDCWGSDAYQQCVAFQLSMGSGGYTNFYRIGGVCRDIPIFDIKLGGLEFCVGVSAEDQRERHKRNLREWARLTSFEMQEHFSYLARRMDAYIFAHENNLRNFKLVKNCAQKTVDIKTGDGYLVKEYCYSLSRLYIYTQNISRAVFVGPFHFFKFMMSDIYRKSVNTVDGVFNMLGRILRVIRACTFFVKRLIINIGSILFDLSLTLLSLFVSIVIISGLFRGFSDLNEKLMVFREESKKLKPMLKVWLKNIDDKISLLILRFLKTVFTLFGFAELYKENFKKNPLNVSKRAVIKRKIQKLKILIYVPYNVISNMIAKVTKTKPPGISAIYRKKPNMPGKILKPTKIQIEWLKTELTSQLELREKLSDMRFDSELV